jgi:hypothetical protein
VRNNPLSRVDPTGHLDMARVRAELNERGLVNKFGQPTDRNAAQQMRESLEWWINNARAAFEEWNRRRRDGPGGSYVQRVRAEIDSQAQARGVDPVLLGAVLRHESAAFERVFVPGGEEFTIAVEGDYAAIGPAQMEIRRAKELEERLYVVPRLSHAARVRALRDEKAAVDYAAAFLQYIGHTLQGARDIDGTPFEALSVDKQRRIVLIAYNAGPENLREAIGLRTFEAQIRRSTYDDETLDEYIRWSSSV